MTGNLIFFFYPLLVYPFSYKLDNKKDQRVSRNIHRRHYLSGEGRAVEQGSINMKGVGEAKASDEECANGEIRGKAE